MRAFIFVIIIITIISCNRVRDFSTDSIISDGAIPVAATPTEPTVKIYSAVAATYSHTQTLFFEDAGYDTKVYKEPLHDDILYIVQANDKIDITEVIDYKDEDTTYIKVITPLGDIGYIKINSNPYKNEEYSLLEMINVNNVDLRVLKMTQSYTISEGTVIRSLPTDESDILHEVTHTEAIDYWPARAITSDYQWVKIDFNNILGWVHADSLNRDIGGPTIETPEATIFFDLIGGNQI